MELINSKIKEVVVVEGYHDLATLKRIYSGIDIYITNGSEISQNTLEELKTLNKQRGLILFLDPDFQGERIRRIINDYVGNTKHAFLTKKDCISKNKKKVGIEHANRDKIIEALGSFYQTGQKLDKPITLIDLFNLNLIGNQNSKELRKKLGETLGIGLNNGKSLCNKLNMFGISLDKVIEILEVRK
ncbi:MAG: ribonuclease M5 [Bacilli bacterium]|nr:ribonuclease M5 [Bacilli bacterium]